VIAYNREIHKAVIVFWTTFFSSTPAIATAIIVTWTVCLSVRHICALRFNRWRKRDVIRHGHICIISRLSWY